MFDIETSLNGFLAALFGFLNALLNGIFGFLGDFFGGLNFTF